MKLTNDQRDKLCRLAGVRPGTDPATLTAALVEALDETREEVGADEFQRRVDRASARQTPAPGAEVTHARGRAPGAGSQMRPGELGDAPLGDDVTDIRDVIDWGVGTGRFTPARAEFFRGEAEDERRATGSTRHTEATIRNLRPLYYEADNSSPAWQPGSTSVPAPGSATPLTDRLEEALYGPSQEERERRVDLAAEAEVRAQIEREHADQARSARRSQLIREQRAQESVIRAELDADSDPELDAIERQMYGPRAEPRRPAAEAPAEVWSLRPDGQGGSSWSAEG